jgi:AcrR family transcriptional regulator
MASQVVPRLTRAQSRAQTRQRIVDAAMRVFARHGYAGASVNAIAEQAGYTIGAPYSNFATKDEVFRAAFEQHCAAELAALDALVASSRDLDELLAAITDRFTDLDEQHRERWALWAELWLYGQRHPDSARRLSYVQAQTRAAITRVRPRRALPRRRDRRRRPRAVDRVHALPAHRSRRARPGRVRPRRRRAHRHRRPPRRRPLMMNIGLGLATLVCLGMMALMCSPMAIGMIRNRPRHRTDRETAPR